MPQSSGVDAVPELDADEVPVVRSRIGTDFDGDGGGIVGQTLEMGVVFFGDLGHMEERDDRQGGHRRRKYAPKQ